MELTKEQYLKELQVIVDEAREDLSLRRYVEERKMHLFDNRFAVIDRLLKEGVLQ